MSRFGGCIFIAVITLSLVLFLSVFPACAGAAKNGAVQDIWTGTWDSPEWGEMSLVQNGNKVTGQYEWQGGKITGTVSGNMLKGTWSESPSYEPPNDAGDFEFTISADGKSFTGRWRYGSSGDWKGSWSGSKV